MRNMRCVSPVLAGLVLACTRAKRARLLASCVLLSYCAFLPIVAHAVENGVASSSRADKLFNAFQVLCNLRAPDMRQLSSQATAMRLSVLQDASETTGPGETVQRKAWLGLLGDDPFALRAEEMRGAKGVATTCSIEGPVPDPDAFRTMVMNKLRLNDSPERQMVEGAPTYYWDNVAGDGTTIAVRDWQRQSSRFVQVKLMNMVKKDH